MAININLIAMLHLLADGKPHSGEALGKALGISRSAVWKLVKQIELHGIKILRLHAQGYCLSAPLELFDRDQIISGLDNYFPDKNFELELLPSVDSTNRYLLERLKNNNNQQTICLAEHQSAGKGRSGRDWVSPLASNIYLSLSWCFPKGPAAIAGLTLSIGIAVAALLRDQYGIAVDLKWPNDIFFQGKKLAGVLVEMSMDSLGVCHVVIGIGINLSASSKNYEEISQPWTALNQITEKTIGRNQFANQLLKKLLQDLQLFTTQGFSTFHSLWPDFDMLAGNQVTIQLGEQCYTGLAQGIAEDGGLIVFSDGASKKFNAGEVVSVRAQK